MAKGDKIPRKPGTCGNRFTENRKQIYLAELRRTGLKPDARLAANVHAITIKRHREKDPEFFEAEVGAMITYRRLIEDEIQRRGIEGISKPITVAGKKEVIREYSDALLIRLAKRHIPEYRDQLKVEQSVEHSGMVSLEADLRKLTPRGQELLLDLVENELLDNEEDEDDVETGAPTE